MNPSQQPLPVKSDFDKELRTALSGLYDPAVLRGSSLIAWLGFTQHNAPVVALRRVLLQGIEALRPQGNTPPASKSWRVYQILRRRYTEQLLQRKVADDLGLSLRQIQREEKIAREMLRDYLWTIYQLDEAGLSPKPISDDQTDLVVGSPGEPASLERLRDSLPVQGVNLHETVQDGLLTLKSVLERSGVTVDYQPGNHPSQLYLQTALLRQGVLNILVYAINRVPGGSIFIQTSQKDCVAQILIEAIPLSLQAGPVKAGNEESLDIARDLLALCGGEISFDVTGSPFTFRAVISLPIAEPITVLVVDDHADTLQLYQRYLTGSRYCFVGANSTRQGLDLAATSSPKLILLDVMMPESDGWEFLGQLRVHPETQNIPVIICSIVPQANLALSLGAEAFLSKPVSQADLLRALDHQISRMQRESR